MAETLATAIALVLAGTGVLLAFGTVLIWWVTRPQNTNSQADDTKGVRAAGGYRWLRRHDRRCGKLGSICK